MYYILLLIIRKEVYKSIIFAANMLILSIKLDATITKTKIVILLITTQINQLFLKQLMIMHKITIILNQFLTLKAKKLLNLLFLIITLLIFQTTLQTKLKIRKILSCEILTAQTTDLLL